MKFPIQRGGAGPLLPPQAGLGESAIHLRLYHAGRLASFSKSLAKSMGAFVSPYSREQICHGSCTPWPLSSLQEEGMASQGYQRQPRAVPLALAPERPRPFQGH